MRTAKRIVRWCGVPIAGLGLVWACGFDSSLREYLSAQFWLPFAKGPAHFARPNIRRVSAPFAGMTAGEGGRPLANLRAQYQKISEPGLPFGTEQYGQVL